MSETQALETFFSAWSIADTAEAAAKVAEVYPADGLYEDPMTPEPLTGPEAIAAYVSQFTAMAPGATATVTDTQTQHGKTRCTVEFKMADGMVQHGQYFAVVVDGQISTMTGFVGTGT